MFGATVAVFVCNCALYISYSQSHETSKHVEAGACRTEKTFKCQSKNCYIEAHFSVYEEGIKFEIYNMNSEQCFSSH